MLNALLPPTASVQVPKSTKLKRNMPPGARLGRCPTPRNPFCKKGLTPKLKLLYD